MGWENSDFYSALRRSIRRRDRTAVVRETDRLVRHLQSEHEPYDPTDALDILKLLRRRRYFAELRAAAEAFVSTGCNFFAIRRSYAQSLLDLGILSAGEHVLERLVAETRRAAEEPEAGLEQRNQAQNENAEARGLIGRLYKQQYVEAPSPGAERNRRAIRKAIHTYHDCYREAEASRDWHGINAVALAWRARHDGIREAADFEPQTVATAILDRSTKMVDAGRGDLWVAANGMEASIALGDWTRALDFAKQYVADGRTDAFEIAGTLRNLRQVWLLPREDATNRGIELTSLLEARLRELDDFDVVEITPVLPIDEARLERVFAGTQIDIAVYRAGLERAASVARIGPNAHVGIGTGFVVSGGDLHPAWAEKGVLLTNYHVVPDALEPAASTATFFGFEGEPRTFSVESLLWSSPQLDAAALEMKGDLSSIPLCPIKLDELEVTEDARVQIIGHPLGGDLHFSLNDNRLLARKDARLHYRAPTQVGNSGSPVFDMKWNVVGVHRMGSSLMAKLDGSGSLYEANEGVSIIAIRNAISSSPEEV